MADRRADLSSRLHLLSHSCRVALGGQAHAGSPSTSRWLLIKNTSGGQPLVPGCILLAAAKDTVPINRGHACAGKAPFYE